MIYYLLKSRKAIPQADLNRSQINRIAIRVNDIGFRLLLIPAFGIVIPVITNMIDVNHFSNVEFKLAYAYNIGIAFIVWHGNRFLLFSLRAYFNWFNQPIRKVIALLVAISFFTIPVTSILLVGWYFIFYHGVVDWAVINESIMISMICVLFITHVYETVFLVKDSENEIIKIAQLEKSNMENELRALKNQIDPHFLFNSLNTMAHLITENPSKAKIFTEQLADVYRYILQNRSRNLVLIQEEMEFLEDYFYLLKIRYQSAVQLNNNLGPDMLQAFTMPPISLQILVENAFKHNDFSMDNPLTINLYMEAENIVVHNKLSKRIHTKHQSKTGLINLNERYRLITAMSIEISETSTDFIVKLPILKID